jgi:Phosphate transport (Pho88)
VYTLRPTPEFKTATKHPSSFNKQRRLVRSIPLLSFALKGTPSRRIIAHRYLQPEANMPPFNKMFVMIPVMLAARKLDGEDPNIVHMVRVAYGVVQLVCFLLVGYAYVQATLAAKGLPEGKIYIPQAAMVRWVQQRTGIRRSCSWEK